MSDADYPVVWIEPHCVKCRGQSSEGPTWCQDNVYEPCEDCGKQPVKYELATYQLPPLDLDDARQTAGVSDG